MDGTSGIETLQIPSIYFSVIAAHSRLPRVFVTVRRIY
jgi:hypothetical protein